MRWVFLRGLVREQRHWGSFLESFASRHALAPAELCPLDFPGIGTETARAFPASMQQLVADLRRRTHLGARERVGIFSMSLGSMCALEWASNFPDEVAGVVLVNTSAADISKIRERLSWVALKAFAQVLKISDPYERESVILSLTSNLHREDSRLATQWAHFAPRKSELVALATKQLWVAARFRAPPHLDVPALILSSVSDRLASPHCSARLARRYGVENHVHLEAGHDVVLDDPEWVIRQTLDWKNRYLREA
jgi:pimeloyl-ACP methyl ester carboxylesterase